MDTIPTQSVVFGMLGGPSGVALKRVPSGWPIADSDVLFLTFTTAFFTCTSLGRGMYEAPFNGLYSPRQNY